MAQAKNIRLYTPAGEKIDDLALAEDYLAADKAGPFRVGRRAFGSGRTEGKRRYAGRFRRGGVASMGRSEPERCSSLSGAATVRYKGDPRIGTLQIDRGSFGKLNP